MNRAVAYYRVSTEWQNQAGHSLAAQRSIVRQYVESSGATLVAEFEEAESAYRLRRDTFEQRPALRAALALCRRQKSTLVIAALDRLARNVVFVATLVETKIPFVALDIPGATPFMIHIYAAMAEEESRQKGRLISAALALAKERGIGTRHPSVRQAAAARMRAEAQRALIDEIRSAGIRGALPIAKELNRRNRSRNREETWSVGRVRRILQYLGCLERAHAPANQREAEARGAILLPMIAKLRAAGKSMTRVAEILNERGWRTGRRQLWTGGRLWNFVRARARRGHVTRCASNASGPGSVSTRRGHRKRGFPYGADGRER
jgi:DNA invertase Pin-like site-specific DNA recombinase